MSSGDQYMYNSEEEQDSSEDEYKKKSVPLTAKQKAKILGFLDKEAKEDPKGYKEDMAKLKKEGMPFKQARKELEQDELEQDELEQDELEQDELDEAEMEQDEAEMEQDELEERLRQMRLRR